MNHRSIFIRSILLLAVILIASFVYLPGYYEMPFPQKLEPKFNSIIKLQYIEEMTQNKTELALIGDSVLYLGIDPATLEDLTGRSTYSIGVPGSGSAVWFLAIKNIILDVPDHPKYVVVVFRDTMLTVPSYRTTGRYFGIVDDFARRNEPIVSELAYINELNILERFSEQYLPLYSARRMIRDDIDRQVRYTAPSILLNCGKECVDSATDSVFGRERLDVVAQNQAVEDAGQTLYGFRALDFEGQVDQSFLPYMLWLAKENNIHLIFVRTKTLVYPAESMEPPALRDYGESLRLYLADHGVDYLDYSHDERLNESHYFDTLHFNAEGKQVFTKILATDLIQIMEK